MRAGSCFTLRSGLSFRLLWHHMNELILLKRCVLLDEGVDCLAEAYFVIQR